MCSRFNQEFRPEDFPEKFGIPWNGQLKTGKEEYGTIIFPKYEAYVIRIEDENPVLTPMYWSLKTRWKPKEDAKSYATFNAKSETMASSPLFGPAWRDGRRCVIPVSDFREPKGPKGKVEWKNIVVPGEDVTLIAGIWDQSFDKDLCFTMLTCRPNDFMGAFHDRMPVILKDWQAWLDPELSVDDAKNFLKPWTGDLRFA